MIPPPFPKEECLMPARFGPPHQFPDCLQNARSSFGAVLSASRHAPSLVVALLSVTALLVSNGCQSKQAAPPTSPPDVEVVDVVQKDVPIYGEWVATLDGYVNAQIQPQVSGYLVKQDYKEGSFVQNGEVLFEIDARPFQATLDQVKAQLAQAQAQLGRALPGRGADRSRKAPRPSV